MQQPKDAPVARPDKRWQWGGALAVLVLLIACGIHLHQQSKLASAQRAASLIAATHGPVAIAASAQVRAEIVGVDVTFSIVYGLTVLMLITGWYRSFKLDAKRNDITASLRASEETYRSMVIALNDGVLIFDEHGRVKAVNPAAERLLDCSVGVLRSTELLKWRAIDTDGRPIPAAELPVSKALRELQPQRGTTLALTGPSGVLIWLNVNVEPLIDAASGRGLGAVASISDITQRREAEAELLASEENNRLLMNSLADGMFVAQDHRFVYANQALPAMLGYAPGEFTEVPFEKVVAPDLLPTWNARFAQRVSTAQPEPLHSYEVRFLSRDGRTEIELELVASRAVYRGRPAVLGIVRDITERKKTTAELEGYRNRLEKLVEERTQELVAAHAARTETENFAQTITDNQPMLLAYIDTEFRLMFANRAYLAWYGKAREEMVGRLLTEVLGEKAVREARPDLLARVLAGEAIESPLDLVDSRGRTGHFWTYRLPDIQDGKVRGYFFIASNVTELRQAQERLEHANDALQQADAFTRLIADNIPGRVSYWDHDMRCRFVNQVYCEWFGLTREDVIGRSMKEIFGAKRLALIEGPVRAALRGQAQHFERQETSAAGRAATTLLHYMPDTHQGEVRGFFVLALDVTQSRQAEQTLQRLNVELVLARDKAQAAAVAKSAFLANMSHEIRTPMNAILGLTYLLRVDPNASTAAERLARVSDAADHLMNIINDILDLSKIESGKLVLDQAEFSLDALVARTRGLVEEQARAKGLALVIDTADLPRIVRGDSTRLSQALVNLLANAVKFTASGTVSLTGRLEGVQGSALRIRFEVSDTGIGIDGERIEHIFTAFEQADGSTTRRFGGTGLGLGITRQLARLMGGDAGAVSTPGVGSTFWISVVLQSVASAGESAQHAQLEGLRALVVDEPQQAREATVAMLRRLGMRVDTAPSGQHALAAASAAELADDPYDVVLIDWMTPPMDGLETARRLRAQARGEAPAFILLGNTGDDDQRDQARALGMTRLLQKPLGFSTLHDQLMSLLVDPETHTQPGELSLPAGHELPVQHHGARVLLAEDNPVNQDVGLTLLTMAGLEVDIAETGIEAVAMAKSTPYRLILMDVQMPELDGLQATRQLRAHPPTAELPIIAMTANAYAEDRAECIAAGMNDYLTKPVDPTILYEMLARWLSLAEAPAPKAAQPASARVASLTGIEGLNVARGLAFFAGDEAVFRRVLRQFAGLYGGGVASASEYLAEPSSATRIEALRRELHSIGGACAAIGASTLSEQATHVGELLRRLGASPAAAGEVAPPLSMLVGQLIELARQVRRRVGEADGVAITAG